MEKEKIQKTVANVRLHTRIVIRGLLRTLYGTAVAGLIALAIYGFFSVTNESGWVAVWDFVASCATLVVALSNMYLIGGCKKGGKNG